MSSCNAVRTNPFIMYMQVEEERETLKKKEKLQRMLTDSEFSVNGICAINLMLTRLDIINTILLMK